jgi:hypothetical protein
MWCVQEASLIYIGAAQASVLLDGNAMLMTE